MITRFGVIYLYLAFRFGNAPEGLLHLLESFALKKGESRDAMRSRVYKRLWQILWVTTVLVTVQYLVNILRVNCIVQVYLDTLPSFFDTLHFISVW